MYSNLCGLSFAQDANGNWGYRKPGADTVFPFNTINASNTSIKYFESSSSSSGGSSITNTKSCNLASYSNVLGVAAGTAYSDSERYVQITHSKATVTIDLTKANGIVRYTMYDKSGKAYAVEGAAYLNGKFNLTNLPPDCSIYCYAKSSSGSSTKAATSSLVVI